MALPAAETPSGPARQSDRKDFRAGSLRPTRGRADPALPWPPIAPIPRQRRSAERCPAAFAGPDPCI